MTDQVINKLPAVGNKYLTQTTEGKMNGDDFEDEDEDTENDHLDDDEEGDEEDDEESDEE